MDELLGFNDQRINRLTFTLGLLTAYSILAVTASNWLFLWTHFRDNKFITIPISIFTIFLAVSCVYAIIGLSLRRLHDFNASGRVFAILLIPLFGWIVALVLYAVLFVKKGNARSNQFGEAPNVTRILGYRIL